MSNQSDLLLDVSILYRSTQKYYDRMLQKLHMTYAQLPILIMIYEQEGITMQQIANQGVYDKGTISKNVKNLQTMGFIRTQESKKDKRNKELYTTDQAKQIMFHVYGIRRDWWHHLTKDIQTDELDHFISLYQTMAENARRYANTETHPIHFYQWQKVSLDAYPDQVATVLSTGGCNFRCPACVKSDLVFLQESTQEIPMDDVIDYLNKRRGIIQAVSIEGGEPLMQDGIAYFLRQVKTMGYKVKISTNGSFPDRLKELVNEQLVDYVSMRIKNGPRHYGKAIGMDTHDVSDIQESAEFLIHGSVDYEFWWQPIKEFHNEKEIQEIAQWLQGAKRLVVAPLPAGARMIQPDLHGLPAEQIKQAIEILRGTIQDVQMGD